MGIKTEGVNQLVYDVLQTILEPYNEDIIEDVFLLIENNPVWLMQYKQLCEELKKDVVNVWIAKYTKKITGLKSDEIKIAKRSELIHSYTKLTNL
jgi:hypothetical protein